MCDSLENLYRDSQLQMSAEATNSQWRDMQAAVDAAWASLDVAAGAMAWMETKP